MELKEKQELIKIGVVAIIGIMSFIIGVFWLKGYKISNYAQYTFYFKNVNGLEPGAALRWNGLKVGVVEDVTPVLEDKQLKDLPANQLIELGRQHLNAAEKALKRSSIEDLAFVRDELNKGQLQIALGQANQLQQKIRKGEHVKVVAVLTRKEVPIGGLNQVTIVPSGIIGEQYLDITTLYMGNILKAKKPSDSDDDDDLQPQFVVLEPTRLDSLIRTNMDSAAAVRDLANRFNALFKDEDAEHIKVLIESLSEISSDEAFHKDIKDSAKNIKDITTDFNFFRLLF